MNYSPVYLPVLRLKKAELDAVARLHSQLNTSITLLPLFEPIPRKFDPQKNSSFKSVDEEVTKIAQSLLNYWGHQTRFRHCAF